MDDILTNYDYRSINRRDKILHFFDQRIQFEIHNRNYYKEDFQDYEVCITKVDFLY